jgi:hypothetical protein
MPTRTSDIVGNVSVLFEGCSAESIHARHLESLTDPTLRLGPGLQRTSIVVAEDFVRSVKSRLPKEEANAFHTQRGSGVVGGKAITSDDGDTVVVLTAELLRSRDDEAVTQVRQLVAHELAHAAIADRDGATFFAYRRLRAPDDSHAALLLGLAAKIIEEVRIERWVIRSGLREGSVKGGASADLAIATGRGNLVLAITPGHAPSENRDLYDAVFTTLRDLFTYLGDFAAEELEGLEPARPSDALWNTFAGRHFDRLRDLLAAVPIADAEVGLEVLDQDAIRIARVLREWHVALGYQVRDEPGGKGDKYFTIGGFAHHDADRWWREQQQPAS